MGVLAHEHEAQTHDDLAFAVGRHRTAARISDPMVTSAMSPGYKSDFRLSP